MLAIVCRGEKHIADFAKIVPFVPYLRTPNKEALIWATDKIEMRKRLTAYNKQLSPAHIVVEDAKETTIKKIKEKISFPLMVKPASLAGSLLVSICHNEAELKKNLTHIFRRIEAVYKENKRQEKPKVLVEQFMKGEMYSIDAYVDSRGRATFCPLVEVMTGRAMGFTDFFGYRQLTPTLLSATEITKAEEASRQAIAALGARSTTVHIELIKDKTKGWRIIELGSRLGGFRHDLYKLSYGINHSLNDVLVRVPKPVVVPKKRKAYALALNLYPQKEGVLKTIQGAKEVEALSSFVRFDYKKKIGDYCRFASKGGKSVVNVYMSHKDRAKLLADVTILEEKFKLITTRSSKI